MCFLHLDRPRWKLKGVKNGKVWKVNIKKIGDFFWHPGWGSGEPKKYCELLYISNIYYQIFMVHGIYYQNVHGAT